MYIEKILHNIKDKINLNSYYNKLSKKHSKIIYLLATENYGNLGDHHIAKSEINFIKKYIENVYVEEIPASEIFHRLQYMKKYIRKNDLVCLPGGGNIGNQYMWSEKLKRYVISELKDYKIIVFPQTIFYTDDEEGSIEFNKTKNVLESCKNIHLFVREKYTYDFVKNNININVYLTPDIVLSSKYKQNSSRNGIVLCLRNDSEKLLNDEQTEFIYDLVNELGLDVTITDTQVDYHIELNDRDRKLNEIISTIQSAQLVITDRLHGMVFCAISGTPCIALSNYNKKVIGTYEWIKDLAYVNFLEDIKELPNEINRMLDVSIEDCNYPLDEMLDKYKPLIDVLQSLYKV